MLTRLSYYAMYKFTHFQTIFYNLHDEFKSAQILEERCEIIHYKYENLIYFLAEGVTVVTNVTNMLAI